MTAPRTGSPFWAASQAGPWTPFNKAARIFDAFCFRTSVLDRDLTAPPGSPVDGARYLVATGATGAWAAQDGRLAIYNGSGSGDAWLFADVDHDGTEIYVADEGVVIRYESAAWSTVASGTARVQDMNDVDATGITDGQILKWDFSNGLFFPADDNTGGTSAFRGAMVKKSADQTSANYSTISAVSWDAEIYDNISAHDNVTNNSRLTVPVGATVVRLAGSINIGAFTSGSQIQVEIRKNGTDSYDGYAGHRTTWSGTPFPFQCFGPPLQVTSGDYFELFVQCSDTSVTVNAAQSNFSMEIIE